MKKLIITIIICFLLLATISYAHIPEIITEDRDYISDPIVVNEPEISYAYYGKLNGQPHNYKIVSEKPFHLYVGLLVPYVGQEETSDVEFHIMKDGEKIVMMHDYSNWTKWYEEYGGDWYLQGPAYEADVEPGTYIIEVHSDTNSEEYSLAIGNIERFESGDILKTIFVLPLMKAYFWGNYTLLIVYIVVLVLIAAGAIYIIRKFIRKKKKKVVYKPVAHASFFTFQPPLSFINSIVPVLFGSPLSLTIQVALFPLIFSLSTTTSSSGVPKTFIKAAIWANFSWVSPPSTSCSI